MGIRYLSTFIKTYPVPLLNDVEVQDTSIVIDGAELLYYLCYEHGELDFRCGGEYTSLREIIVEFFDCLRKCNIKPHVVFDAFKSESNIVRYLKKKTEKLPDMRKIVDGHSDAKIEKPLLGKYVLQQTLSELEVPYVIVPGDADPEIAAIANSLRAPVLGGDTDFCVFDVKEGFLLIKEFKWKQRTHTTRTACQGKIFRRQSLINTFGISGSAIAYLAPMMSIQDSLPGVDFINFVRQMSRTVRIPQRLQQQNLRRPNWIEVLLVWLAANYTNDDDTIERIATQVPGLPEDKFKECLMTYRDLPNVEKYIEMLKTDVRHSDHDEVNWCTKVEGTKGGICFLSLVLDDQDVESSHTIALPIRKALYQAGTHRSKLVGEDAVPRLIEMDRRRGEYGANPISFVIEEERLQCLHLDDNEPDHQVITERRHYVFDALIKNSEHQLDTFKSLGKGLDLLAATFKYWYTHCAKSPSPAVIRALAFTISACNDGVQEDDLPSLRRISDTEFSKDALHYSMQWQCCVNDATRLNRFLWYPVTEPLMGKLFSGKMFQKAFAYCRDNGDLTDEDVTANLFEDNEDAKCFYLELMQLVN